MNKGISKWPSRVLNLLVVLSMVIALCIVLAPPIVAEVPTCDPVERYDGCHLVVNVNLYTKDANGDFAPVSQIEAGDGTGDTSHCFYVNAVVVNTGNVTAGNISAHIDLGAGMELAACDVGNDTKYWEGDALDPTVPGRMADFWWKVCCIGTTDWQTISVTASAATGGCRDVVGTARIQQIPEEITPCLNIEIIEAPGWAAPGYTKTFPNAMVTPCTNFGIKALVTNTCPSTTLYNVNATIEWTGDVNDVEVPYALATIVGGDPLTWQLGNLYPGESRVVAWTLHCDGQGDVDILVKSLTHLYNRGPHNPYTVEQFGAGDLTVEITSPEDGYEVCAGCEPGNIFPIDVLVTNNTGETVTGITVQMAGNDTVSFEVVGAPFKTIASLAHGHSETVTFSGKCKAVGNVTLTANAGGSGALIYYNAVPDTIVIYQKQVLASIQDYDTVANICEDPPFQIIGAYKNCSGVERAGVEVSIFWTGNATLILTGTDKPMFDRQQDGDPLVYVWEDFASLNTVIGNVTIGSVVWHYNTQTVVICPCCETLVRWRFDCTGQVDVDAFTRISWTGGDPVVTYTDDSETIDIEQDWKAHLLVGQIAFLQGDGGCMFNRNAFVPGQSIHVVVPVVNVGQAEAQNVQITFKILGDTARWDYVSMSGDAVPNSWIGGTTNTGVATIASIPGNSTKKLIVQLECTGPGAVQFSILSVTGTDGNSGAPIRNVNPGSNIIIPNCNLQLEQIPFTVTIVNPIECTTYNPGDLFGVKAVITNGSEDVALNDVEATIHWRMTPTEDHVELAAASPAQQATKRLENNGNVSANSKHEITWELMCTEGGEVFLWVTAEGVTDQPIPLYISAKSDTVNVHQQECIDIGVDILSPGPGTYIATSEEFAVTARVNCTGTEDQYAQGVQACIYLPDGVALGKGETSVCKLVGNGTMETGTEQIVTWTLHALWTDDTECRMGDARINVSVSTTSDECQGGLADPNTDYVDIAIYPTAHLVAEIESITPVSPFVVCEEFEVTYRVYNYGEADAWEVEATLSVTPDGSVRPTAGPGGYTQYLGTIAGWRNYSGEVKYVEKTFILHCKQVCESTITITPKGNDECGWHWKDPAASYTLVYLPGREIDPEFIEPVSQTVKQVVSKPMTGDMTEYDISLVSDWNLISLPLIPNSTAIATVLADVNANVDKVWAYDAATASWTSWVPGLGGDLSTMVDGKGYWIDMNAADVLTIYGVELKPAPYTPKSYPVVMGWNLIGFKSTTARTAGDYLAAIAGDWTRMYTYGNAKYSALYSDDMMNPGKGYWIAVTAAGTIYP